MIQWHHLKMLSFETLEQYFEYIIESKLNGQHSQARELFNELSDGNAGQRVFFFQWCEMNLGINGDSLNTLKHYFKHN